MSQNEEISPFLNRCSFFGKRLDAPFWSSTLGWSRHFKKVASQSWKQHFVDLSEKKRVTLLFSWQYVAWANVLSKSDQRPVTHDLQGCRPAPAIIFASWKHSIHVLAILTNSKLYFWGEVNFLNLTELASSKCLLLSLYAFFLGGGWWNSSKANCNLY